jgi:hypothetical protein
MVHGWRDLWPYAHTWWGWIVAIATILFAVYRGPKAVWETYEWYMERLFDSKVKDFLESKSVMGVTINNVQHKWPVAADVRDVAVGTGMSEKRVLACLKRLKKKKAVSQEGDRWKIA